MAKKFSISLCIVCMNRLYQLKQTLKKNLADALGYEHVQFIILNYNSSDGMEEWIKENITSYIESGKVVYYHTTEPKVFSHSHSKNLAFKLADGEIVCNVNADHFIGKGFCEYINDCFNDNENIVLTTIDFYSTKANYAPPKDVYGKVCVRRTDFFKINGFDEKMVGYGFEDWDFVNRLQESGLTRTLIEDDIFLSFIGHCNEERYSLQSRNDDITAIYINYQSPWCSEILILYNDARFEKGTLLDNSATDAHYYKYAYFKRTHRFVNSLKEKKWLNGHWKNSKDTIHLFPGYPTASTELVGAPDRRFLRHKDTKQLYYLLLDAECRERILEFRYLHDNKLRMEKNLKCKPGKINKQGFGKAIVMKNFDCKPITL